jgi:hypothetical protein
MVGIVAFHVVMFLLGLGIVSRVASSERVGYMLGYLHKAIGITAPFPEQVRTVALIWIGSTVIIVDGCLFLLVFIASLSKSG